MNYHNGDIQELAPHLSLYLTSLVYLRNSYENITTSQDYRWA